MENGRWRLEKPDTFCHLPFAISHQAVLFKPACQDSPAPTEGHAPSSSKSNRVCHLLPQHVGRSSSISSVRKVSCGGWDRADDSRPRSAFHALGVDVERW